MKPEQFETALKNGVIRKFDDLKSLADFYKLDYATLEKENEKFNGYMKAMKDPEFDCMFFKDAVLNTKGPFYAIRLWPRVHHTMGGLEINEKAQVLDVKGNPIAGLYAAGEATAGVHGMVRLVPSPLPTASSLDVLLPAQLTAGRLLILLLSLRPPPEASDGKPT